MREPGPLIREQAQRDCLRDAMMRGFQRAAGAHGADGGTALSIDTAVSSGAMQAVEAAVDTWARGVLRRVVRETAFLKRSRDRRPLAGMVVRPHSDKGKSLLIQGMRKPGEKRAREDLSKMIEARAEGTDLHQAWKKRRKQFKQKPAAYLAEREGTLDRVAAELLTATVGSGGVGERYAGQDGLGRLGVQGRGQGQGRGSWEGSRGAAPEDGEKSVVTIEALRRLVGSRRRVEAVAGARRESESPASWGTLRRRI